MNDTDMDINGDGGYDDQSLSEPVKMDADTWTQGIYSWHIYQLQMDHTLYQLVRLYRVIYMRLYANLTQRSFAILHHPPQ